VVPEDATTAVMLIGPLGRTVPSAADFARLLGIVTAHSLRSMKALAQQTRRAKTDGLTGLLNKTYVQQFLQQHVSSGMAGESLGVFLFDLDHFKHFNDRNGHLAGDELLRSMSELLRQITREGEILGRYGGEEFLLLMPGTGKQQALAGAERVRAAIAAHEFHHSEGQPLGKISISGGIAVFPEDGQNAGDLIAAADQALYEAKRQGRDRVLAYQGTAQVMKEDGDIELAGRDEDEIISLEELVPAEDETGWR
jgi:diguanylate cyclase (GGDEF)-like protein